MKQRKYLEMTALFSELFHFHSFDLFSISHYLQFSILRNVNVDNQF